MTHIDGAARSLMKIINDILDLSKIEAGKLTLEERAFALRPLLEKVAQLIQPQAQARFLRFRLDVAPDLPAALIGDSLRIEQILMNLAANAVKFTDAGEIAITARLHSRDAERAQLELGVRDSGIGITPEQMNRLFTPFVQADDSTTRLYGGSGLGLTICKQLVELMGGRLHVESQPGQGSYFCLRLNLRVAAEAAVPQAVERPTLQQLAQANHLRDLRILLVEDHAQNRRLATTILQDAGLQVDIAVNGEEAVHRVQQTRYDALLMDVQMPVMDGMEATRRIRALPERESLPIIAMTANAYDEDRDACLGVGMNDFLSKPIDAEQLLEKLSLWLRHPPAARVNQDPSCPPL